MAERVPIAAIHIGTRLRALQPDSVKPLAESIRAVGLLSPIAVVADGQDGYRLVAGLHRLRACEQLGWTDIPVEIQDQDAVRAEMAELDENLHRAGLTVLERGEHLIRRLELLEALGVRAGRGRPKKNAVANGMWTKAQVAKDLGVSERTVDYSMQLARSLPKSVRDIIRGTSFARSTTVLDELAQVKEDQEEVAQLLVTGKADTVWKAQRIVRARYFVCQVCGTTVDAQLSGHLSDTSDIVHCTECGGHSSRQTVFGTYTKRVKHPVCPSCAKPIAWNWQGRQPSGGTAVVPASADPNLPYASVASATSAAWKRPEPPPTLAPEILAGRAARDQIVNTAEELLSLDAADLGSKVRDMSDPPSTAHVRRTIDLLREWVDRLDEVFWR